MAHPGVPPSSCSFLCWQSRDHHARGLPSQCAELCRERISGLQPNSHHPCQPGYLPLTAELVHLLRRGLCQSCSSTIRLCRVWEAASGRQGNGAKAAQLLSHLCTNLISSTPNSCDLEIVDPWTSSPRAPSVAGASWSDSSPAS